MYRHVSSRLAPTSRDVRAAHSLALASLSDFRRCMKEYGPNDPATRAARAAYESDEQHRRNVVASVNR